MKLSIIIIGRNDGYVGFLERLSTSIKENDAVFKKYFKFSYEFLFIDWCSREGKEVYKTPELKALKGININHILVPRAIAIDKFCTDRFYQFFAKNVGYRHATGEWILSINADNIIKKDLALEINRLVLIGNAGEFYRTRWWQEIKKDKKGEHILRRLNCDSASAIAVDRGLATTYSGDFLLCKKSTVINEGRGHDELEKQQQTALPQATKDGEI